VSFSHIQVQSKGGLLQINIFTGGGVNPSTHFQLSDYNAYKNGIYEH
jgi:hypothetical protein